MSDTIVPGRIDIVIFPNGGKEVIGRVPADPEIPESEYWQEVLEFVARNQNLPEPKKFTGYYSIKDGNLKMNWMAYDENNPVPAQEIGNPESQAAMTGEDSANAGND